VFQFVIEKEFICGLLDRFPPLFAGFPFDDGCGAPTGVFAKGCVETEGFILAPQVGLEPTTLRLTAAWCPEGQCIEPET
jgi:hypothetical protein